MALRNYRVQFRNGSCDIFSAKSAADAREKAERDFGGKVSKVEVIPDDSNDEEDDDDVDEDEADEEEDEDDEDDE